MAERVMRLSPAFGWWWPVVERHEMYGLERVEDVVVTRDGNVVVLASGSEGERGLIEVTRPQDAMMGLRVAPFVAGPGEEEAWEVRHGEMGFGVERFDDAGRLVYSDLPGTGGPVHYEYGDGTDGVPDGALKRVVFSEPYSLTRYTDFIYDSRGKLAALRDEDGYETRVRVDERGDLVLVQSPEGDFRVYLYDADHRLRAVIGEEGFADVIEYNETGMVTWVSGMRGFLRAAPWEVTWLLDRLSPDAGLPWSPLTGYVTPSLVGLSDYLEDLCSSASDCDDGLPLTFDSCEAGFCRHEVLGTFPVPAVLKEHGPCVNPEGCKVVVTGLVPCALDEDWRQVCDDEDPLTWDVCVLGFCENLPCQGSCGCDPSYLGEDCAARMVGESGLLAWYQSCVELCCRSACGPEQWHKPPGCFGPCQRECLEATLKRLTGGAVVECSQGTLWEYVHDVGLCTARPRPCEHDWECDDFNPCTVERCEETGDPAFPRRCVYEVLLDDTPCDDHNACTVGDRCVGGRCEGTGYLTCDDGNACTLDRCYPCGGCANEPVVCDEPDDCYWGSCSPLLGCVVFPHLLGTPCVHPSDASGEAVCDGLGRCELVTPSEVACDDHDPCTVDGYEYAVGEAPGCVHEDRCEEVELEGAGIGVGHGWGLKFPGEIVRLNEQGGTAWSEEDDADHDGLQDMAEYHLAKHFPPYFVFDSQEKGTAPWEPVVVYQAHPLLPKDGRERVRLNYIALWDYDPGYGPCSWCSNSHAGDVVTAVLWVERKPPFQVWEPTYLGIWKYYSVNLLYYQYDTFSAGAGQEPTWGHPILACQSSAMWLSDCPPKGFNPIVYLSASKHHPYLDAFGDVDDSPYSTWCGWWCDSGPFPYMACCDDVNGMGARVLADIEALRSFIYGVHPFGNNVGEPSYTVERCNSDALQSRDWTGCQDEQHSHPLSERFCTHNHPPAKFVNIIGWLPEGPASHFRWEDVWEDEMDFAGGLDRFPSTAPPITCVLSPNAWDDAATYWECLRMYLTGANPSVCEDAYGGGLGGPRPPDWYRAFRRGACGSGGTIRQHLKTPCLEF